MRRRLACRGAGVVEEDPLAPPPGPGVVLAEAPDSRAELEAESPRRGAGLEAGLALGCQGLVPLGAAGLLRAAVCGRQQGKLWSRAFTVQQGRELPEPQVRARVRPLALQRAWWKRSPSRRVDTHSVPEERPKSWKRPASPRAPCPPRCLPSWWRGAGPELTGSALAANLASRPRPLSSHPPESQSESSESSSPEVSVSERRLSARRSPTPSGLDLGSSSHLGGKGNEWRCGQSAA